MEQSENYYLFTVPAIDTDENGKPKTESTFRVLQFAGHEELSRPFAFRINLTAKEENISDLILKEATFTIHFGEQSSTYHGIISHFDQLRKIDDNYYYQARLMPKWYLLSLYKMSDIYLNQSLPTIIDTVFTQAGFTANDYRLDLTGDYSPPAAEGDPYNRWSYVCQYEETCLAFLSRLMEREGLYYYFDQQGDPDPEKGRPPGQMVITDHKISHRQSAHQLFYKAPGTPSTGSDDTLIQDIVFQQRLLPKQVIMKNYDYEQASQAVMEATAFVSSLGLEDKNLVGDVHIFGENFSTQQEGQTLAKIRAEELLCKGKTFTGFGTAVPLVTGELKHLTHDSVRFTGWYLVTEVRHEGQQSLFGAAGMGAGSDKGFSYKNDFTFIRDSDQFRPRRVTAKPKIQGTLTAFIDSGGSGQYADLDHMGRYLVTLPFALTPRAAGKASTRIRMATPYAAKAGAAYGMHLPLHKGAEVLLSFRDGDPDLPIISGAAFNSLSANPVTSLGTGDQGVYASENLVIESAGGNKIVMDDTKDAESILLHSPYPDGKGSNMYIGKNEEGEPAFSFKASGNKYEVIVGQENDLVMGSLNIGVVGSLFEGVLGMANELHIATSTNATLGGTTELKVGPVFEYKKFSHEEISEKSSLLGHEEVEIAAGSNPIAKTLIQTVATITAGVCAAAGAIMGAAAGEAAGALDPEGTHPVREGVVAETCIAIGVGLQIAALAILKKLSKEMANPASKLTMNAQGITMSTLPTATKGIVIGTNPDPLDVVDHTPISGIKMTPDGMVTVYNNTVGMVMIELNTNGICIDRSGGGTVLVTVDGVTVSSVTGNKVEITNDQVVIEKTGGGTLTLDTGAKLAQGTASIELTGNQIKLVGQGINAAGGALSIDAAGMVKIGA